MLFSIIKWCCFHLTKTARLSTRHLNGLTPREVEVLLLIVAGKQNKEIAQELVIESSTVEIHLRHIYRKLDVSNRTQAAIYALFNGLISSKTGRDS